VPLAVVVVRNAATHDARVLRCARTLRSLGYEAIVLAVASEEEANERAESEGVPIVRVTPRAPLAPLARALRRAVTRLSGASPPDPPPSASAPPAPARRGLGALARAYRLLRTLSYYRRGTAATHAFRPSLLHCNDCNTMWIGVAAKLLTGCALVYDSHELWPDRNGRSEPRWWLLACEALFLRVADATVATSPGHADAIARRYRVPRPRVVRNVPERNGAGMPASAGSWAEQEQNTTASTIVYAGAVTSSRGLEQAIAALPHAPGVSLRIVGPGGEKNYRVRLAGLAAQHRIAARVRLDPPVPPGQVVAEIAGAAAGAALIQPSCLSYALSLPNKLFEYLAAELPVLAADLPVLGDFVRRNGVGVVVAPNDPEAIATAMLEIVEPTRNRQLRAAVADLSASLSWEREAERLKRAYRDATGAPAPVAARQETAD